MPVIEGFYTELLFDFIIDLLTISEHDPRFLLIITDRLFKVILLKAICTLNAKIYTKIFVKV